MTEQINHQVLIINSLDRVEGSSTNFKVSYNNTGIQNLKKIVIKQISIPWTFYNIDEYNNKLVFFNGVTNIVITVPIGNYSINTLVTYINSTAEAVAVGLQLTIPTPNVTSKLLFTSVSIITLYGSSISTIFKEVGLDKNDNVIGGINILLAPAVWNLSGHTTIYIRSNSLIHDVQTIDSRQGNTNIMITVPIKNVAYGEILHWESPEEEQYDIHFNTHSRAGGKSIIKPDIRITDRFGNVLNSNGSDVIIIFKMYY
jgi:hypothetical protein